MLFLKFLHQVYFRMIIDGKKVAADLRTDLKKKIEELKSTYNAIPGLTVILVGEDPPSKIYVKNKINITGEISIEPNMGMKRLILFKAGSVNL